MQEAVIWRNRLQMCRVFFIAKSPCITREIGNDTILLARKVKRRLRFYVPLHKSKGFHEVHWKKIEQDGDLRAMARQMKIPFELFRSYEKHHCCVVLTKKSYLELSLLCCIYTFKR